MKWLLKKRGLWYRPDARGYTKFVAEAGLFSPKQAQAHSQVDGVTSHRLIDLLAEIDAERKLAEANHAALMSRLDVVEREALGLRA